MKYTYKVTASLVSRDLSRRDVATAWWETALRLHIGEALTIVRREYRIRSISWSVSEPGEALVGLEPAEWDRTVGDWERIANGAFSGYESDD